MLPPALEEFARQPFWNILFLLLAVTIALYSALSLLRRGRRQDVYYLLLGLYLTIVQLPAAIPSLGRTVGVDQPVEGFLPRIIIATPAMALFILGVRAR